MPFRQQVGEPGCCCFDYAPPALSVIPLAPLAGLRRGSAPPRAAGAEKPGGYLPRYEPEPGGKRGKRSAGAVSPRCARANGAWHSPAYMKNRFGPRRDINGREKSQEKSTWQTKRGVCHNQDSRAQGLFDLSHEPFVAFLLADWVSGDLVEEDSDAVKA